VIKEYGMDTREVKISRDPFVIGRDPEGDIVLRDIGVSRSHARIRLQDEGFVLEDLGSRNGTFVNEHKVPEKGIRSLRDGDQIRIGHCLLQLILKISSKITTSLGGGPATETVVSEEKPEVREPPPAEKPLSLFRLKKMEAFLIVHERGAGIPHRLRSDRVRIGSLPTSDIVVNDPTVAREHAEIVYNREGFFIVDRGSAGGTLLNGVSVTVSGLDHRGYLRFGNRKALFTLHEEGKEFPEPTFVFRDQLSEAYPERREAIQKAFQRCREAGLDFAEDLVVRGVLDPEEWWAATEEFRRRRTTGPRGWFARIFRKSSR
jgi:pSer/pThr/pTyr-binding forkhead associated (FHA) protein